MREFVELVVGLVIILAGLAAPFALGVAAHTVAAGTFGLGFIAGLGFFPAVIYLADR